MWITARANAWRKCEGVIGDRRISRKRKCVQLVYYPGMHKCTRDDGTNKETTGEGPGLLKTIW